MTSIKERIRMLSQPQRVVFDQLCAGGSGGSPTVLDTLVRLGLVEPNAVVLPSWPGPVIVMEHNVPLFVHVAWAEMCSEEYLQ